VIIGGFIIGFCVLHGKIRERYENWNRHIV
jgi:hypothetical protein